MRKSKSHTPQLLDAVKYGRVSSKEQEKEGFSIPAQFKLLDQYAQTQGLRIVREFVDVETAKRPGRTGFDEMIKFLKRSSVRVLLVEKTDRLYRNLKDYVTIDELNLEIHFVKENVILSHDSRSSEKFMHGIQVLMAKNYIDNLSEEVKKGVRTKAAQGLWPSYAPPGYVNTVRSDGKRIIVPDVVLGPVVTLHKILRKRIYTGEFSYGGTLYQGTHEPLVTREVWERVQEILDGRHERKHRKVRHNFAFPGMVQC